MIPAGTVPSSAVSIAEEKHWETREDSERLVN